MAPIARAWRVALDDGLLLVARNQLLILAVLVAVYWARPLIIEWQYARTQGDHRQLYGDRRLTILEGEDPRRVNTADFWIERDRELFGRRSLAINASRLPDEGFISVTYTLTVERAGRYKLFIAGRPPGGLRIKGKFDYSPYRVIIDGSREVDLYEEKRTRFYKRQRPILFFQWWSYGGGMVMTKIADLDLAAGAHSVELRIDKPAPYSGRYIFVADAFYLVPKGWVPDRPFSTFPDDVFAI
jgi:hypothetical protein